MYHYLVLNTDHWKGIKDLIPGCLQFWPFLNAFHVCPPRWGNWGVCGRWLAGESRGILYSSSEGTRSLTASLQNATWCKLFKKLLNCLRCVLEFAEWCTKTYLVWNLFSSYFRFQEFFVVLCFWTPCLTEKPHTMPWTLPVLYGSFENCKVTLYLA